MNTMKIAVNNPGRISYRHSESVTDTTSTPLSVEISDQPTHIIVAPGTDAKVQYTLSFPADVDAGTALWIDWSAGVVTAPTAGQIEGAVTAVRLVSTGTSKWEVSK